MSELTVSGGTAGIAARVADMRALADRLDTRGEVARSLAGRVGAVAADETVLSTQLLAPGTGASVLAEVAATQLPPHGLAWLALEIEASAVFLRGAATAYQATDAALAVADELLATTGGLVLVNGGILTAAGTAVLADGYDALPDDVTDLLVTDAFGTWLEEVGDDPLDVVMGELYDHPWVTDSIISAMPTVLGVEVPLVASAVLPFPLPVVPLSYEQVVGGVLTLGGLGGYLATGRPAVELDPDFATAAARQAQRRSAATSLEEVFDNIDGLGDGEHVGSEVRVTAIPDGSGAHTWLVEVPGTQAWSARSGVNPSDLAANLHAMSGSHDTALEAGVREAIDEAMQQVASDTGVPIEQVRGQPVALAGYSQGAIIAASMAADPSNGLNVTTVVSGGGPIANHAIPEDVTVLSIEHEQDAVHHLDGNPNPAGTHWTTVGRDVDDHASRAPDPLLAAHSAALYADTAALIDAQAGDDPALAHAMRDLQRQFDHVRAGTTGAGPDAQVFQYDLVQEHE